MKSLDTNILARFFVNDPEDAEAARQRPAAASALSERAFVPVTVLLEFEWVMRGFYAFPRAEIARVLRALAENVSIEDRGSVVAALDVYDQGLEFADALHLTRSSRSQAFVTFDRRLAKRANRLAITPRVELLT